MQKHPKGMLYLQVLSAMMGRNSVFSKRMDAHLSESPPEECGREGDHSSVAHLAYQRAHKLLGKRKLGSR